MPGPTYVRCKVIGDVKIRDAVTRESVGTGGVVQLLARPADGTAPAPCGRHPKRGAQDDKQPCTCGGTLIDALVQAGAIEVIAEAKAPKG